MLQGEAGQVHFPIERVLCGSGLPIALAHAQDIPEGTFQKESEGRDFLKEKPIS